MAYTQDVKLEVELVSEQIRNVESNCNEIMFINQSSTEIALVDKFPVQPNSTLTLGGNVGEKIRNNFKVELTAANLGSFFVWRKIYVS